MDWLDSTKAILTYLGVMVLLIAGTTLFISTIKTLGIKRSAVIIGVIGTIWTIIWETWSNLPDEFYFRFRSYFYLLIMMFLIAFVVVNRDSFSPRFQKILLAINQIGMIFLFWFWFKLLELLEPEMRTQLFGGIGIVVIIGLLIIFVIGFILSRIAVSPKFVTKKSPVPKKRKDVRLIIIRSSIPYILSFLFFFFMIVLSVIGLFMAYDIQGIILPVVTFVISIFFISIPTVKFFWARNRKLTPLMWIAWEDEEVDNIRALLECQTDVAARDNRGWTALMFAAQRGNTQIVKVLLESDATADLQNDDGETALMLAIQKCNIDTVRALLAVGVNIEVKDKRGRTAERYAKLYGCTEIVQLLQKPAE